jgi:hypothetical protein
VFPIYQAQQQQQADALRAQVLHPIQWPIHPIVHPVILYPLQWPTFPTFPTYPILPYGGQTQAGGG